mgnify:CR=1 FL=1
MRRELLYMKEIILRVKFIKDLKKNYKKQKYSLFLIEKLYFI